MDDILEKQVERAKAGDAKALESVMMSIKDLVYNLSLKMLLHPEDAKDATQEILVRVMTHLGSFREESRFQTWVYRVTTNYLLTKKGKQTERFVLSFEEYADLIDLGQSPTISYTENQGERRLLEEEVKVSCTQGLLLCLNEKSRMVYILGILLEFNSQEGAAILEITPESFRQQLSRSKKKIKNFLNKKCGLVNPKNPCRCNKKIDFLINENMINPKALRYAPFTNRSMDLIEEISHLEKSVALYRSTPSPLAPDSVIQKLKEMISVMNTEKIKSI